jgi:hypothetical protein
MGNMVVRYRALPLIDAITVSLTNALNVMTVSAPSAIDRTAAQEGLPEDKWGATQVFGGYGGPAGARVYSSDMFVLNINTLVWERMVCDGGPLACGDHTATVVDNRYYSHPLANPGRAFHVLLFRNVHEGFLP